MKKFILAALVLALAIPAVATAQVGDLCLKSDLFANRYQLEIVGSSDGFFTLAGYDETAPAAAIGSGVLVGDTFYVEWIKTVISNGQVSHFSCALDAATSTGPGTLTRVTPTQTLIDDIICEPCP